jgi:hypothetical protein
MVVSDLPSIRYYLSERFRLRFEETNIEEMLDDSEYMSPTTQQNGAEGTPTEESHETPEQLPLENLSRPVIVRLDSDEDATGEGTDDEFAKSAFMYKMLLEKIDALLDGLNLDA